MKGEKQNMNKFLTKIAKIFLGLSMAAGVGVAISNGSTNAKSVFATEYDTLFTIQSADVVTSSGYQAYNTTVSNRDWVITFGGNNKSVGTNSSKRSNCKLSSYTKYAVSPVTTSTVASAFAVKTSLTDVGKISYTFNGGSNQTSTKVYAIYSSDNSTFSQLDLTSGTQGGTIYSGASFEFDKCSGYFALLFEATNSSGNWRIDDVNVTFYSPKAEAKTLSSIQVTDISGKTWQVGETVSNTDLRIVATYSSGDPATITNGSGVYFDSNHSQTSSSALVQGSNTITVYYTDSYGSASNTVTISAIAPLVLDTIAVETAPTKTDYIENENFDPTGLVIRRNFEGGTHDTYTYANHTSEFTFNPSTSTALTTSDTSVTITYGGKTTTQAITVDVQHGTESNPYTVAEALAAPVAQGVYVTGIISTITEVSTSYGNATYRISDDGTTTGEMIVYRGKYVNNTSFTSSDQIKLGDTVVVTGNLTVYSNANQLAQNNYIVTLTRKELSSITLSGYTDSYYVGDTFSFDGTVTAHYNDSSTKTVTATSVSSPDMSSSGNKSVTVTYEEGGISKTANYSITVNARTLSSISVDTPPTKTTYAAGECFDPTDLVITTVWNVGSNGSVAYNDHSSDFSFLPTLETELKKTDTSVTITYGGKSTTQAITVNEVDRFYLIKSTSDLSAGSSYLIGNLDGTAFMSSTQNSNNRGMQSATASSEIVNFVEGMEVFTLGGSTGAWTFYANNSSTKGYIYAASSSSNYLRTQATNNANGQWSIAIDESGNATIIAQGSNTHKNLKYNSSNNPPIFSAYDSTGTVALWKMIDTSESIALNRDSVSDMKGNTNHEVSITATNFTPTTISATYSVANIASITAGTISNDIIPLNIACNGVGSTVATITVNGGNETHTIDLSITVAQKPASLTLVNGDIKNGEIEVKLGGSKQVSFTALDTDEGDYSIDYSGITASSSNANVALSGNVNMVLNGSAVGDATVTCTISATAGWQTPITQTLIVHVVADYNEKNVAISVTNGVNVDQGDELVIADHISSATATTHFGTNNNPILDDELLFSYTNNRSAAVAASNFVWDVTDPDLDEGDTETRTVYVFVTFNESYAGTSFTAIVTVESRPVVGLKVDGVSKTNGANIDLELPRNSTYNLNEHVTVDPTNATQSHSINYAVEEGSEYVSVTNGVITVGSKIGETVACVSATPVALSSYTVYFWISITREAMTLTADLPVSISKLTSLSVDTTVIFVYETTSQEMSDVALINTNMCGISSDYDTTPNASYPLTIEAGNGGTGYSFKTKDNTYLSWSSGNTLTTSATKDDASSWTIASNDNGNFKLQNVGQTARILQYNTGSPRFACYGNSGQTAFQIYGVSGGEKEVTVTDALFNVVNGAMSLKDGSSSLYDLGLCDASGTSFDVSKWNTLGNSFTSSIISDNKLAYAKANENGNEIEQFLAVYDYVIGKKESGYAAYASANDFLGRVASGKITASPRVNPLVNIIGENTNTVAIIVIISMVSVTAIGGYFFLRKRKENI